MHIHSSTFSFLNQLAENNEREWFQQQRATYEMSWQNMKDFVQALITGLSTIDRYIEPDIPISKCLFRIYRDTRFGKDKSPYKTWLGAGISTFGRKINGPEYYIHIQPNNSFFACGYWRPEKEHLSAIRQEIDYNGDQLFDILSAPSFSANLQLDTTEKLKRPPSGYEESHPYINFLKLKSFTVHSSLSDKALSGPESINNLIDLAVKMYPFKLFLHQALDSE